MNGIPPKVAAPNVIEECERLFVYQTWPELPSKVQQSILRKAKAFASSPFPDASPSASGEINQNDGKQNERT